MSLEVVIVDDDKIILFLHKIMLEKSGLADHPLAYLNGKELLTHLASMDDLSKRYLVLLDINMPEMNGWEFLDAIQTKPFADRIYVVIVTSSVDASDKEKAKEYRNVIDYYEKPIDTNSCNRIKLIPKIAPFFQSLN
jgi:CheY-like chemotaxis protein